MSCEEFAVNLQFQLYLKNPIGVFMQIPQFRYGYHRKDQVMACDIQINLQ